MSGWVDVNPEVLEHYWGSYTGGLGKFLNNSMATMVNIANGGSETFTTDKIKQVPFVRNYVTAPSPGATRAEFYQNMKDIEAKGDILNRYKKAGNRDRYMEYREENIAALKMENLTKAYKEKLDKLKEAESKYKALGLDDQVERMEKEQQKLFKQYNKKYKDSVEGKNPSLADILGFN